MNQALKEFLTQTVAQEHLLWNEPMEKHTTFCVGGEADVLIRVKDKEQLTKLVSYFGKVSQDYFILGKGSNLLVSDKGYRGVVLDMSAHFTDVRVEGNRMIAQAGASLPYVATLAANHGLSGLEFAAGIPGTIGGAVVMNAGAYDGEMKQVVKSVTVLNRQGEEMELDNATMEFGYRTSIIKNRPFLVQEVVFELCPGDKEEIMKKGAEFNRRRREKQPLEYPSAGSTFKRPEGHFAGKLIMDAGLRGYRIGGAQVSEKHCGFVINVGNATASDIYDLMDEVSEKVKEQFGVALEPEVVRLGEF
ncbi:MAG: UDP-N-acetylmuramate dehydrogenase [Lachnospiraceae bacterium]|nr:UDP-N-acetylmuramate dehydrogenase [Lachnospiraceae bacterium]